MIERSLGTFLSLIGIFSGALIILGVILAFYIAYKNYED